MSEKHQYLVLPTMFQKYDLKLNLIIGLILMMFLYSNNFCLAQNTQVENQEANRLNDGSLKSAAELVKVADKSMSSSPEKAIINASNALKIAINFKDTAIIDQALNLIGEGYFNNESFEKSHEYFLQLLNLRKIGNNKKKLAGAYNNLGIVQSKLKAYPKALKSYKKALELKKELGMKLGSTLNNIGTLLERTGKFSEALYYYRQSLEEDFKKGDAEGISTTYLNIGDVLRQQGKLDHALEIYAKGLKIATDSNYMLLMKEHHEGLYKTFKANHKFENALFHQEAYSKLKDSIFTIENKEFIVELEIQNKIEKNKHEIEFLNRENELKLKALAKQTVVIWLIVALFVVSLVFLVFFFSLFTQKKAAVNLLEKHKAQITDSIMYARRIQLAVFPPEDLLNELLPGKLLVYRPKDIVSGDFYWVNQKDQYVLIAVADCTGHGVPGAFMSMLGITLLKEITNSIDLTGDSAAGNVLNALSKSVIEALKQKVLGNERKDGMDIALCIINTTSLKMQYSGAHIHLNLVRNNEVITYKANRMPVGIYIENPPEFDTQTIKLQKDDKVYLFTDGFQDQFGGMFERKYLMKNLIRLIKDNSSKHFISQQSIFESEFDIWKGNLSQIDDVLILGFSIESILERIHNS